MQSKKAILHSRLDCNICKIPLMAEKETDFWKEPSTKYSLQNVVQYSRYWPTIEDSFCLLTLQNRERVTPYISELCAF